VNVIIRKGRSAARRLGVLSKRWSRRPLRAILSPFEPGMGRPLLVHCGHHKIGTLWFHNVLRAVSDEFGLRYQKDKQPPFAPILMSSIKVTATSASAGSPTIAGVTSFATCAMW